MSLGYNSGGATLQGNPTINPAIPNIGSGQTAVFAATAKTGQAVVAGTGINLRTVTGGKTFYLTSFTISAFVAGEIRWVLVDNGAGGTVKAQFSTITAGTAYTHVFPVPLQFTTNCYIDCHSNSTAGWTMTGFEQ